MSSEKENSSDSPTDSTGENTESKGFEDAEEVSEIRESILTEQESTQKNELLIRIIFFSVAILLVGITFYLVLSTGVLTDLDLLQEIFDDIFGVFE